MTASAQSDKARVPAPKSLAGQPGRISWEVFQRRYLSREDGNTYEWPPFKGVIIHP
jgi:hypothetical protein